MIFYITSYFLKAIKKLNLISNKDKNFSFVFFFLTRLNSKKSPNYGLIYFFTNTPAINLFFFKFFYRKAIVLRDQIK